MKDIIDLSNKFKFGIFFGLMIGLTIGATVLTVLILVSPYLGNTVVFWSTVVVIFLLAVGFAFVIAQLIQKLYQHSAEN
ncbi:hypothetical protein [Marinicella sp. W31]|uniref:hypothetical protein n=1 Tax=Marinicella sp. W31 TaxID=3023713 RepID=UPI0037582B3E